MQNQWEGIQRPFRTTSSTLISSPSEPLPSSLFPEHRNIRTPGPSQSESCEGHHPPEMTAGGLQHVYDDLLLLVSIPWSTSLPASVGESFTLLLTNRLWQRQNLYAENYETLMKEIKEGLNNYRQATFHDWKIQQFAYVSSYQIDLQIKYNSNKNPSRKLQADSKIYMKNQRNQNRETEVQTPLASIWDHSKRPSGFRAPRKVRPRLRLCLGATSSVQSCLPHLLTGVSAGTKPQWTSLYLRVSFQGIQSNSVVSSHFHK